MKAFLLLLWLWGGFLEDAPHSNVVESVSADVVDGVWVVSTWTPDGTTTRPATTLRLPRLTRLPPLRLALPCWWLLCAALSRWKALPMTSLAAIDEALAPFAG